MLRQRRGRSLWAAATYDAAHSRAGDVGQIIFCARCGRYVERGAPRALQYDCPGQCGTRAAVRALRRITGRQPKHPNERIELAIRRPWPIPLYATASARCGAAATRAAEERRGGRDEPSSSGWKAAEKKPLPADFDNPEGWGYEEAT